VRFGVLGTGPWATQVHVPALAAHPTAELVGVWGADPAEAKALGAEHEVPGYTDVDELLGVVDAVSIALPPDVQVPLAVRAAAAGRHLLLEKPVALDLAAADELVAATRAAGVATVVFFTDRFQEGTATWLAQAARTRPVGGAASWLNALAGSSVAGSTWRQERGALWDLAPHLLSVLIPALGPVVAVQAAAGRRDTVHLVLAHEAGAASTVTVSHTVAPLAAGTEVFVHGDAGRLVLIPERNSVGSDFAAAVDELAVAAVSGGASACDVVFGRDVVAVLDAAERALASGCREDVVR
jgi:predicted dehydrogenase